MRDRSFAGSNCNSGRLQDGFLCRMSINFPFALNHLGAIQEQCHGRNKTRRFSFLEMNFSFIFGKTQAEIKGKQLAFEFFFIIINKSRVENPDLNSWAKLCLQAVNLPGARP